MNGPDRDVLVAAHALIVSDRPWQSELRLRQARWRERIGAAPGDREGAPLGSALPVGDTISNFLTATIGHEVEKARRDPMALISAPRIYENMLSSQPLTFNLFGELAADLGLATRAARLLWPDLFGTVTDVRFEWSPGRQDVRFLDNRSAFDVALVGVDPQGHSVCVGIEVKYHEDMTQDPGPATKARYAEVAHLSGVFSNPDDPELRAQPLRQLWLDHLLALSMREPGRGQVDRARFVVLAPAANPAVAAADVRYRRLLCDALTYERMTMHEVVAVVASLTDAQWVNNFRMRYLEPSS